MEIALSAFVHSKEEVGPGSTNSIVNHHLTHKARSRNINSNLPSWLKATVSATADKISHRFLFVSTPTMSSAKPITTVTMMAKMDI
jgi:hypothetical protein